MKFESPIEELLAMSLAPKLREGAKLDSQVKFGKYRVDFTISWGDRRVVIECDGREFHSFTADQGRDCDLVQDESVVGVYRLRGCDIVFAREESVNRLHEIVPQFFGDPAHDTIDELLMVASGMNGWVCKPIYRFSAHQVIGATVNPPTLYGTSFPFLAEIHATDWSRQWSGPTDCPLGDSFVMMKWQGGLLEWAGVEDNSGREKYRREKVEDSKHRANYPRLYSRTW